MIDKKILEFYEQTSSYTYLGPYKKFAKKLPNDIKELCYLQRMQILHPTQVVEYLEKNDARISPTRLVFEEDVFPTACSMFNELLRLDKYHKNRSLENNIHLTCRCQAILLASTLKAKGIPARVRSGFAFYINNNGTGYDHWITEYYSKDLKRWVLVDADCSLDPVNFNIFDIPRNEFCFGAEAYLKIRKHEFDDKEILYTSNPPTYGIKAALHGLFYDFYSLMNQEGIFLHLPSYVRDKKFLLDENELKELDQLALLLLNPDENFAKLQNIWQNEYKYRIRSGALN